MPEVPYLPAADINLAARALADEMPNLVIESIELERQGFDNFTFVVNGDLIVRFPKGRWVQVQQEVWALRALDRRVPVTIPCLAHVGSSIEMTAYRRLEGARFAERWQEFSNTEMEATLDRLIEFFVAMHASLDISDGKQSGLVEDTRDYARLRNPEGQSDVEFRLTTDALYRREANREAISVLHNDLHGENILVSNSTNELAAVIDFGDVVYGQIAVDLNYLCEYGCDRADWIAKRYRHFGGAAVDGQSILDHYYLLTMVDYLDTDLPPAEREQMRKMLDECIPSL